MLAELESMPLATPEELLKLIERRSLYGRGCGFVDMSLLASTAFERSSADLDLGQVAGVRGGRTEQGVPGGTPRLSRLPLRRQALCSLGLVARASHKD